MFKIPSAKQGGSLVGIKNAVATSSSPNAELFVELLGSGKISPLATRNKTTLERFGLAEDCHPRVAKIHSPFFRSSNGIPSPKDLKGILQEELTALRQRLKSGEGDLIWVWTDDAPNGQKRAADEEIDALVDNILDLEYKAPGFIPALPSPILEERCAAGKADGASLLSETSISCSILPDETAIQLQHFNEATTFSTVLAGCIVYIVWPPTTANLSLLGSTYTASIASSSDDSLNETARKLEGGVAVIQTPGEGFRIPPFCPVMALTLCTTVLANYCLVHASTFISICTRIPFVEAWFASPYSNVEARAAYGNAMHECLGRILACEFEEFKAKDIREAIDVPGPLFDLVKDWDGVRAGVFGILNDEEKGKVKRWWLDLLLGCTGRKCLICGEAVRTKKTDLPKHFQTAHWN